MAEGAKTLHPYDEGGREIGHPLYSRVVRWGQVRKGARPAAAPRPQEESDHERELKSSNKSVDQPAENFMKFSFPALVDQCNHQTLEARVAEEESREGDEGVAHPLHLLVVEHSARRRDPVEVKVLDAALSCAVPATGFRNTPSKVEVGGGVCEGGSEAEDEDVEEPAHLGEDEADYEEPAQCSPSNASSNLLSPPTASQPECPPSLSPPKTYQLISIIVPTLSNLGCAPNIFTLLSTSCHICDSTEIGLRLTRSDGASQSTLALS